MNPQAFPAPGCFALAFPPELLRAKFADLTEHLSGDAVKEYPFLANLPTESWRTCVFNGGIYGLPVPRAAVLYVFRGMVDDDIPMNAGCLRPIRVILPEGSMLSPRFPAAVVVWAVAFGVFGTLWVRAKVTAK